VLNRQSVVGVVRIQGLIDGKRGCQYSWCGYRVVLGFYDLGFGFVCLCRFFSSRGVNLGGTMMNTYFGLWWCEIMMDIGSFSVALLYYIVKKS
jgi:hypothetical protein